MLSSDTMVDTPHTPEIKKTFQSLKIEGFMKMADRAGFEPAETSLPHTLSKRAHSTTLPPVQVIISQKYDLGLGRRKLVSISPVGNSFFISLTTFCHFIRISINTFMSEIIIT